MNNQLLKANEVAQRLNISRSQAFTLMRNGELPTVRFGRLCRVRPEDLEDFIIQNLSGNPEINFKTELAAATASLAINSVNPSTKGDHHE
jgi:excisionase family DNA binding protein